MIMTDEFSARLRERAVRPDTCELLVANFSGSGQEPDLTDPPNCNGVGRIRHFTRTTSDGWPDNSLPIDPASAYLGLGRSDAIRAQVFQNAVCNWRCWYCYVPFNLLSGNDEHTTLSASGPGALHDPSLIVPANNDLFSSGTLGRYSRTLNSVIENHHKEPAEVAGD